MLGGKNHPAQNVAAFFVALALFTRLLAPAGWMPTVQGGHPTFTICSATGLSEAWVDADGKLHKSPKESDKNSGRSCVLAGLSVSLDLSRVVAPPERQTIAALPALNQDGAFAIGRGLAAPPPPATGPPSIS